MIRRRTSRTLTVVAVGFLVLDGILLLLAGIWTGRSGLIVGGVGFSGAAVLVVVAWRVHVRRLEDLHAAFEARERELAALQDAIDRSREP